MCGIWGFEGRPARNTLKSIISKADERGGHSFGFFGITPKNEQVYLKMNGRADIELLAELALKCEIGIGHSRLATSGDLQLINSQPLLYFNVAIVHNGNIDEHEEIMARHNYSPRTKVDSEAIIPMLINDNVQVDGAFLAIKYDEYSHTLISYNQLLPLIKSNEGGTNYYCSKEWRTVY